MNVTVYSVMVSYTEQDVCRKKSKCYSGCGYVKSFGVKDSISACAKLSTAIPLWVFQCMYMAGTENFTLRMFRHSLQIKGNLPVS